MADLIDHSLTLYLRFCPYYFVNLTNCCNADGLMTDTTNVTAPAAEGSRAKRGRPRKVDPEQNDSSVANAAAGKRSNASGSARIRKRPKTLSE